VLNKVRQTTKEAKDFVFLLKCCVSLLNVGFILCLVKIWNLLVALKWYEWIHWASKLDTVQVSEFIRTSLQFLQTAQNEHELGLRNYDPGSDDDHSVRWFDCQTLFDTPKVFANPNANFTFCWKNKTRSGYWVW
jgi:hypothetical protein